jgi:hypothetical protein
VGEIERSAKEKWIQARKSRSWGVMGLREENGGYGSIDRRRGLRQSTGGAPNSHWHGSSQPQYATGNK